MDKAIIAGIKPIKVTLKEGEEVYYCRCGRSKGQPFCDGSHEGTSFMPLAYTSPKDQKVLFCTCKQTKNPPFCDGSHVDLTEQDLGKDV